MAAVIRVTKYGIRKSIPAADLVPLKTSCQLSLLVPIEVRPHIGAPLAASCANELRLKIRQPNIIRPLVAVALNTQAVAIKLAQDRRWLRNCEIVINVNDSLPTRR
jgi:hypothetical protein